MRRSPYFLIPLIFLLSLLSGGIILGLTPGKTQGTANESSSNSVSQSGMSPAIDSDNGFSKNQTGTSASTRLIVKTASVGLQVDDVAGKTTAAKDLISKYDGSVLYSNTRIRNQVMTLDSKGVSPAIGSPDYNGGNYYYPISNPVAGDYAYVSFTVPSEKLEEFLKDVKELGKLVTDSTSTVEVTSDVMSLEAQILSEKQSLDQLESLLKRATTVDEVLQVETALQQRKANIAGLEAQLSSLKERTSEASVTLQLVTEVANKLTPDEMNWWQVTWEKITTGVSTALALSVIGFAFLFPFALVFFGIRYLMTKPAKASVTIEEKTE
jgi:hypothetical protein